MSSAYPKISERVSSAMNASRRKRIDDLHARVVSAASKISNASHQTSVSDFLEAKVTELEAQKYYLRCIKDGLLEAENHGSLATIDLQEPMGPLLKRFRSQTGIVQVMKRDISGHSSRTCKMRWTPNAYGVQTQMIMGFSSEPTAMLSLLVSCPRLHERPNRPSAKGISRKV